MFQPILESNQKETLAKPTAQASEVLIRMNAF
jgi:hypothetical protein